MSTLKGCRVFVLGITLGLFELAHAGPTAEEILYRADAARGDTSATMVLKVTITSIRPDEKDRVGKYEVLVKGIDRSLVKFLYPRSDAGKFLLTIDQDMWFYIPNTRKPIRISPLQRLMGDASNADLAKLYFSRDYIPTLIGEEKIEQADCYVLELKARNTKISYQKITYWVAKENYQPVKADYYVLSGKLLRTVRYTDYKQTVGVLTPTRLIIDDLVKPGHQTVMTYETIERKNLPDKLFNYEYLTRAQ